MEDIEKCIKTSLPNITDQQLKSLCEKLIDLGIDCELDLKYVQEQDLEGLLKPVQIRKLLESWKLKDIDKSTSDEQNITGRPVASSVVEQLPACNGVLREVNGNAAITTYKVPWNKMPKELMDSLKAKARPQPKNRRQMIRIISDDVTTMIQKPLRRHLRSVAQSIVTEYPDSFLDKLGDDVVGSGYDSLLAQLEVRIENMSRISMSSCPLEENGMVEAVAPLRKRIKSYGCKEASAQSLSAEETNAMRLLKNDLKVLYNQEWIHDEVLLKMDELHLYLRNDINVAKTILEVKDGWPFLFKPFISFSYMKKLVGIDIEQELRRSISEKGKRIINFFRSINSPAFQNVIKGMDEALESSGNRQGEAVAIVICILHFFEEKVNHFILEVEDTDGVDDVELQLFPTPCIIAHGIPLITASHFSVSVDGKVVSTGIQTFQEALALSFSYYYIFNIQYSKETASTMEFIQRCLLGLNPDKGTKQQKKKKNNVDSKVLSLCNKLTELDFNLL